MINRRKHVCIDRTYGESFNPIVCPFALCNRGCLAGGLPEADGDWGACPAVGPRAGLRVGQGGCNAKTKALVLIESGGDHSQKFSDEASISLILNQFCISRRRIIRYI